MDAIKLTFEGKSYELTYTRETIKQMENTGFDIQMLAHQPTVQGDKMFAGAFLAKCKGCLLYTSPSPRDVEESRMPSSA